MQALLKLYSCGCETLPTSILSIDTMAVWLKWPFKCD